MGSAEEQPTSSQRDARQVHAGEVLGGYQLLCPIASGGMGQVWAARRTGHLGVSSLVAVKVALVGQAHVSGTLEELFFDEGRVASRIDHPNVCKTYELGENDGVLFLAMEFIDGVPVQSLWRGLPAPRRMDPAMAAFIIAQACAGLHAAHELVDDDGSPLNVVHRDATPQNILVTQNGDVKIVDFGVAKAENQLHATVTGEFKGKIQYLAPEQALSRDIDRRADVFALGCVLYLLTTGERPFAADNPAQTMLKIVTGDFVAPAGVVPGYPSELDAIVRRALAKDAEGRFQTAEEMRSALDAFIRRRGARVEREDLAALVRAQFSDELARRRKEIRAMQRHLDGVASSNPPTSGAFRLGDGSVASRLSETPFPASLGPSSRDATSPSLQHPPPTERLARKLTAIGRAGAVLGALAVTVILTALVSTAPPWRALHSSNASATQASEGAVLASAPVTVEQPPRATAVEALSASIELAVRASPPNARVQLDGAPAVGAPWRFLVPRDGRAHTLSVRAPDRTTEIRAVVADRDQVVTVTLAPEAQSGPSRPAPPATRASPGRPLAPSAPPELRAPSDDPLGLPLRTAKPRRSIDESDPF